MRRFALSFCLACLASQAAAEDPATYRDQGAALMQAGKIAEAVPALESAVRLNVNDALAQDMLGAALAQSGHLPDAIPHLEAACRLKPEWPEARYHLALAYERSGRVDDAIGSYLEVLRIRPDFFEARYLLAERAKRPEISTVRRHCWRNSSVWRRGFRS